MRRLSAWLAVIVVLGCASAAQAATTTVFASGLNNPRGIKFGPGWSGNDFFGNTLAGNVCGTQGSTTGNTLQGNNFRANVGDSCP